MEETEAVARWSKAHDEDTVACDTAGKDTRFHQWWMIVALKWLFKSLCATEGRGRKYHLYSERCWSDYQTNDKVVLVMSCSKCSLYLLDLLADFSLPLSHPASMAISPLISVLTRCSFLFLHFFSVLSLVLILPCLQSSFCCCLLCLYSSTLYSFFFLYLT